MTGILVKIYKFFVLWFQTDMSIKEVISYIREEDKNE